MARVNVENLALTDSRFKRLGIYLGASPDQPARAHALGLGAMIQVWNVCTERGVYALTREDLDCLLGAADATSLLERAELVEPRGANRVRIRGTEGRIEWYLRAVQGGRDGGKKGGRPKSKKTPGGLENETPGGLENETPGGSENETPGGSENETLTVTTHTQTQIPAQKKRRERERTTTTAREREPRGKNNGSQKRDGEFPMTTDRFLYLADRVAKFQLTQRSANLGPGDADFDALFENEFQFTWPTWERWKTAMQEAM